MKTQRWRITFAKTEAMRYTGHLDLILTWERTFRRSRLPLSYSEGFNPRPVINLAAPLPLGYISQGEIGDFWLSDIVTRNEFSSSLDRALPPGLAIRHLEEVPHLHGNKLPSLAQAAIYRMTLDKDYPGLKNRIGELLSAKTLPRERKGKEYDLRPLIYTLALVGPDGSKLSVIETKLSLLPGATGRPDEILSALGIDPLSAMISRVEILFRSIPSIS
jgi:radical SAM-linked protein